MVAEWLGMGLDSGQPCLDRGQIRNDLDEDRRARNTHSEVPLHGAPMEGHQPPDPCEEDLTSASQQAHAATS